MSGQGNHGIGAALVQAVQELYDNCVHGSHWLPLAEQKISGVFSGAFVLMLWSDKSGRAKPWQAGRDQIFCQTQLYAGVAGAQIAAIEHMVIRVIHDLLDRGYFNDLQQVELAFRVLLALHHQHVFEALVIGGPVIGRTIAKTVEPVTFQSSDHTAGVGRG